MNPKDRAGSKKPNLSILPLVPLYEVSLALYEGARKYGPWNWRKEKVDEVIYVDAAIRHLNQWLAGEDIDPDSGLPHISKAIAGLVILRDAQHHDCSIDTRREQQNVDFADLVRRQEAINEKYPNPVGSVDSDATPEFIEAIGDEKVQLRATGGNAYLVESDIGKLVRYRNGQTGVLEGTKSADTSPYTYCCSTEGSCAKVYVDPWGRASEGGQSQFDVSHVVRKVRRQVPNPDYVDPNTIITLPVGVTIITIAGGGESSIDETLVGCKAETRDGQTCVIEDIDNHDQWPVEVRFDDGGDDSVNRCGYACSKARSDYDEDVEESNGDIVRVYREQS